MADRSVSVVLRAQVDGYIAGMKRAQASTSEFGREVSGQGKTVKADLDQVGRGALLMAGGIALAMGASVKAAIDWESAWAGVTKTVDGSASQMAELEEGLRGLAGILPATHAEIAGVAEAAGQLGIKREAIVGFTKTMIDLGETTNLTADQAATSIARMANIMQTAPADIDRVASTLVALGNAGASTEAEILDMSLRIAGAGKQVGLTEDQVLAFANALSSVGVEAEAGGTAISRVFSTIASAVADGGEDLAGFAELAGMSSEAFATAFRDDAAGATLAFIEGLEGITASGGNVFATLENLELGDIRVRDALLRAAGAGDLFRESLALGAQEMESGNALLTEAEKRYDTTAAKMEIARNNIVELGIDIGGVLLPALSGGAEGLSQMAQGFGEMPGPMATVTAGIGGFALAGTGAIAAAALLVPKLMALRTALIGMGTAGATAAAAMPWLAAAAVAVGVVSYVFGENAAKAAEAEERVKGYTDAIREAGDATAGTEAKIRELVAGDADLASMLEEAGVSADALGQALAGSDAEFDAVAGKLLAIAAAADAANPAMGGLHDALVPPTSQVEILTDRLGGMRDEAQQGAEDAETLGTVLDGTGDAADGATPQIGGLADEMGRSAEETEAAVQAVQDFQDTLRAGVDPVFAMQDALRGNVDAQQALDDATQDGTASQAELDSLLQDVASTALDVELAASDLALGLADGSVSADQFRGQLDRWVAQGSITTEQAAAMAEKFGLTADEADRVDGGRTAKLYAEDNASGTIARVRQDLENLAAGNYRTSIGISVVGGSSLARLLKAEGGPIYAAAGTSVGPRGTDTVPAWLTPGEYVNRKSSVDKFGVGFFDALNAGIMPARMSAGGDSTDNSRRLSIGQLVLQSSEPPRALFDEALWRVAG